MCSLYIERLLNFGIGRKSEMEEDAQGNQGRQEDIFEVKYQVRTCINPPFSLFFFSFHISCEARLEVAQGRIKLVGLRLEVYLLSAAPFWTSCYAEMSVLRVSHVGCAEEL